MIIGLDVGGTNVNAVAIKQGKIVDTAKNPTDYSNLLGCIWTTLHQLLVSNRREKIQHINLSTTVSTNAIVEGNTAPVGMIIESGPGLDPSFLCCGTENVLINGYIDHRGREISPLNKKEIDQAIELFESKNIRAVSVAGKFSTRNPAHELDIAMSLKDRFSPITLGHTLSGKLNFPRRVYTSYLNSAIYDVFSKFADGIKNAMKREGLEVPTYILKADGGTVNIATAEKFPVNTILSGPAASTMGACAFYPTDKDAILLDIGGTTTDISFLADGVPLFEPLGIKIGSYNTLVRAIYSVSIGLGGDSAVCVKDGKLKIGPVRKGMPRALGGPVPTPSDAMIVLGLMEFGDRNRALEAIQEIGQEMGVSAQTAAQMIYDTMGQMIKDEVERLLKEINSRPVYTIKELLYGKKVKPEFLSVIGGPAKAIAPILEKKFELPCKVPPYYEAANAVGAALAKITAEVTLVADTAEGIIAVPEIGLHEKTPRNFDIKKAREKAFEALKVKALELGADESEIAPEIVEEQCYNVVRGFYTRGKNIRIKAQLKPGFNPNFKGFEV